MSRFRSLAVMLACLAGLGALSPSLSWAQADISRPWGWDMWDPGWMQRDMWGPGRMGPGQRQRMLRHWVFMHEGVPDAYRGQSSPIEPTEASIAAGASLYAENCARCHGPTGQGDGEDGRALNPSPALLAYLIRMPMAVDEYLLWTISEGGQPFETDMPAFKDQLAPEEIWQIVAFMRAGFPDAPSSKQPE
jgi:mono/diheme cytochrome c family protein